MTPIKGKLVEAGTLAGLGMRGVRLECDGEVVEINGLTDPECKEAQLLLDRDVVVTIAHASGVTCPFCGESDFDLVGLKLHFERGWCAKYAETDQ